MQETHAPELGDLVIFVDAHQPEGCGGYGTVIGLESNFVEVVWPGGVVECSYSSFVAGRWGYLKVLRDAE